MLTVIVLKSNKIEIYHRCKSDCCKDVMSLGLIGSQYKSKHFEVLSYAMTNGMQNYMRRKNLQQVCSPVCDMHNAF